MKRCGCEKKKKMRSKKRRREIESCKSGASATIDSRSGFTLLFPRFSPTSHLSLAGLVGLQDVLEHAVVGL